MVIPEAVGDRAVCVDDGLLTGAQRVTSCQVEHDATSADRCLGTRYLPRPTWFVRRGVGRTGPQVRTDDDDPVGAHCVRGSDRELLGERGDAGGVAQRSRGLECIEARLRKRVEHDHRFCDGPVDLRDLTCERGYQALIGQDNRQFVERRAISAIKDFDPDDVAFQRSDARCHKAEGAGPIGDSNPNECKTAGHRFTLATEFAIAAPAVIAPSVESFG